MGRWGDTWDIMGIYWGYGDLKIAQSIFCDFSHSNNSDFPNVNVYARGKSKVGAMWGPKDGYELVYHPHYISILSNIYIYIYLHIYIYEYLYIHMCVHI